MHDIEDLQIYINTIHVQILYTVGCVHSSCTQLIVRLQICGCTQATNLWTQSDCCWLMIPCGLNQSQPDSNEKLPKIKSTLGSPRSHGISCHHRTPEMLNVPNVHCAKTLRPKTGCFSSTSTPKQRHVFGCIPRWASAPPWPGSPRSTVEDGDATVAV